jgi:glycerol-3-phosphate dehydrogenase
VRGVQAREAESGERFELRARCVVNATGVWVDAVRDMDRDADTRRPSRRWWRPARACT